MKELRIKALGIIEEGEEGGERNENYSDFIS